MRALKRILIAVLVIAAGYAIVVAVSNVVLTQKIAEVERKRVGVTIALEKIVNDQLLASRRVNEITAATIGSGRDKATQVAQLLSDASLNRLALTYLGSDWSLIYSSFTSNVKHMREMLKLQSHERKDYNSRLKKKVDELEHSKRMLQGRLRAPSDDRRWRVEMNDIDRQLYTLRSSSAYREYIEKDNIDDKDTEARVKNEDAIFKFASDYESNTVGTLNRVMAEKVSALRWEEAEVERLKHVRSLFNVWPIDRISNLQVEDGSDGK